MCTSTFPTARHAEDPQSYVDSLAIHLSPKEWADITRFIALGGNHLEQENEKNEKKERKIKRKVKRGSDNDE